MKVIDYSVPYGWNWKTNKDNTHELLNGIHYFVYCKEGVLEIILDEGFKTDGASVPRLFQWVRKKWYNDSEKDLGSITHDAIYTLEGKLAGNKVITREDADDILRGLDRCTGTTNRTKAGMVDKAVEWFAGGKKHWGNDGYHQKEKIHVKWLEDYYG